MHVRQLYVSRYGPMAPFHSDLSNFVLVHGPNEQGKTLLIDSLVRLLFKGELKRQHLKFFGNLRRVTEEPEGYAVMATHSEEIKLERTESLSDYLPFDLSPEDFRNIFLIRDSDLALSNESHYYETISEKLTGLRSTEIGRVIGAIQRLGRLRSLSPESLLVNNLEQGKYADLMRDARGLVGEIKRLREELRVSNFDELDAEAVETKEARRRFEEERERYRVAEKRGRYRKAAQTIEEIDRLQRSVDSVQALDIAQLRLWQRIAMEREHVSRELDRVQKQLEKTERNIADATVEVEQKRARAGEAETRMRRIERELSPRIDEFHFARAEFAQMTSSIRSVQRSFWGGITAAAIAVAAAAAVPSIVTFVLAGIAAAFSGVMAYQRQRHSRKRVDLDTRETRVLEEAERCGLRVDAPENLGNAIAEFERELGMMHEDMRSAELTLERFAGDKRDSLERASGHERRIGEIDAEIAGIKAVTSMDSTDQFQAAVDIRRGLEHKIGARMDVLRSLVPQAGADADLGRYRTEVRRRLEDSSGDAGVDDDPDMMSRLDGQIQEMEERERHLVSRLKQDSRRLHEMEVRVGELKIFEEPIRCRIAADLDRAAGAVEGWCDRVDRKKETAQEALRIFQEIDEEERSRVGDLFGPRSVVTGLFNDVTDGRYTCVSFDATHNQLFVERADGQRVEVEALSGGAYDQLYLAVRFAIAEKLFPESKGFFIMDDPFIKADHQRLSRLVDTLRRFADRGWQILYFSAKKEVLDALRPDISAGAVQLIELGKTLFNEVESDLPSARPAVTADLFSTLSEPVARRRVEEIVDGARPRSRRWRRAEPDTEPETTPPRQEHLDF